MHKPATDRMTQLFAKLAAVSSRHHDIINEFLDTLLAHDRPAPRDYRRRPLRVVKSFLDARGGLEIFDNGEIRVILRSK